MCETARKTQAMPLSAQAEPILPPGRRRFRLTSARGCRKELAGVYAEARNGTGLDWQAAARAASVLMTLVRMIEGSDFEARLEALESVLADRDARPPRNGHDHRGLRQ
jgi:hypothetical protein